MKNQVIEVLDREHGKKVIEYWESRGVDTLYMNGDCTRDRKYDIRYYGVINDKFSNYTLEEVKAYNAKIIELPEENSFPRVMLVSYDGEVWYKRVVFMKKCDMFLSWDNAETIESAEWTYRVASWRYAKEIEPKEQIITLSDINSKMDDIKKLFGAEENDKIVIKVD